MSDLDDWEFVDDEDAKMTIRAAVRYLTLFRMKVPMSSKVRSVHAPPGALELTMIGSKLNSPIGGKPRRTGFVPV
jgi:hypothetical protein